MVSFSQQVPRNYVFLEIATGDWCSYCPGAAMGADDLIANGDPVAVIENHYNDVFETNDSWSRIKTYYGISAYPTANFDGNYEVVVAGSATESMYGTYKPIVDARIEMDSDFSIDIFGSNDGDEYSILVRLQNLGGYTGDNIKLQVTLTESEIAYNWQNQTELNFVNRLMIPDWMGTDLSSYDLTELTDIELDFTFDNTWNDQHCELVLFIQDDDTQEVLQSNKIALTDLFIPIVVDFEADVTSGCEGTTINYTDLSVGEGTINYQWTFEGGTPETSSDQNPSVTYNTGGYYSVQLIASDDYSTDSLSLGNYISILGSPAQPNLPQGESQLCNSGSYDYYVDYVPFADDWEWELNPPAAGTLSIMENEVNLTPSEEWTGDFTLRVRVSNDCGIGDWSDIFEGAIYTGPEVFELGGGGGYCIGGEGVNITLFSSDTDINYELFRDTIATGVVVEGTGSEISFGLQVDTGFYNVQAYGNYCNVTMANEVNVYYLYPPGTPTLPTGETLACNDQTTTYATEGADDANDYNWYIEPAESGEIIADGLSASIDWNEEYSGLVNLTVTGVNDCGEGIFSEVLEINVDDCTAIDRTFDDDSFKVFPNPVNSVLYISFDLKIQGEQFIAIHNHIGQIVDSKSLQLPAGEKKIKIDVSHLTSGIYFVTLYGMDNISATRKFVKN